MKYSESAPLNNRSPSSTDNPSPRWADFTNSNYRSPWPGEQWVAGRPSFEKALAQQLLQSQAPDSRPAAANLPESKVGPQRAGGRRSPRGDEELSATPAPARVEAKHKDKSSDKKV